jgi:hypothetical protein
MVESYTFVEQTIVVDGYKKLTESDVNNRSADQTTVSDNEHISVKLIPCKNH